jgi:hypothetical protein
MQADPRRITVVRVNMLHGKPVRFCLGVCETRRNPSVGGIVW